METLESLPPLGKPFAAIPSYGHRATGSGTTRSTTPHPVLQGSAWLGYVLGAAQLANVVLPVCAARNASGFDEHFVGLGV